MTEQLLSQHNWRTKIKLDFNEGTWNTFLRERDLATMEIAKEPMCLIGSVVPFPARTHSVPL